MKNRAKMISLLMAVCMMLTLLPAVAFAAEGTYGGFTVIGNDLTGVSFVENTWDPDVLNITQAGTYTIKNAGSGEVDANIAVDAGISGTVNIIFDGLNMDGDDYAFAIKTPVKITLKEGSSNKISTFGNGADAINNASGTALVIDGSGSLELSGGNQGNGITGDVELQGGTLSITGGNVGSAVKGNVNITGGTFYAKDGNAGTVIDGNVTISGGSLETSTFNGVGITGIVTFGSGYNAEVKAGSSKYDAGIISFTSGSTITHKYIYICSIHNDRYTKEYNNFIVTGPVNSAGDGVEGIESTANGLDIKTAGEYTVKNVHPSTAHSQMIRVLVGGVKLTLAGVNVDKNDNNALRLEADTNIVLENQNTLDGNGNGISAESNGKPKYTVTFSGSGSLTAVGTGNGIHGHAVIESGDVTCEGGGNGIQGNVTLKEGKLTCEGTGNGIEGTVIVNGGELNSTGKERDGICGNVEINGGSVYCEGKSNDAERSFDDLSRMNLDGGNGIEGNVTMSDGTLTAYSSADDQETKNYIEQGGFFPGLNGKLTFVNGFNPSIQAGKNPGSAISVSLPADGWILDQFVTLGADGSTPSEPTDPSNPNNPTNPTNPTDPTPGGPGTPSHSHGHIDVWYIAGNSFGT
ncbi:MAG: hypothetical protein IJC24_02785, partial [Clostridia bacterium]|nr:hypothetical protein [Clostridia bacterium]